jgi:hypothetical protein
MKKVIVILFLILGASAVYGQNSNSAKQQTYSAVDQFSPQMNPNATWAYGYTLTLGSPLIRYTIKGATCCSNQIGWFGPFGPAPGYPVLLENAVGPSQSLDMDPGPEGEYSVVRWTAPSGGSWDIVGDFQGTGLTTVDVHVLRNSASIFDNTVNGSDVSDFGLTLTLKAGETIDFAVGYGGAFGNDPTGFQAVISPHRYNFQTIDFPEATGTSVLGLNDLGEMVGEYGDAQGDEHGFTFSKRDGFKTIDFPGAAQTEAFAINNTGSIVGFYVDQSGAQHGFLLVGDHFIPLNVPGAVDTDAVGINDQGDIVGVYDTGDVTTQIGFLLRNGHYISIQDPLAPPMHTQLNDINDRGQIVGVYLDSAGVTKGFVLDAGKFTPIDFPDASGGSIPYGINCQGQIVGRYFDGPGSNQGFVLLKGDFEPVVFPAATVTSAQGINNAGQIVGFYRASGPRQGFIATPGKNTE